MTALREYHERVTSNRTEALFLGLALGFFLLFCASGGGLDTWGPFFLRFAFFLFSLNYRVLP
jgi:hypothetical protein